MDLNFQLLNFPMDDWYLYQSNTVLPAHPR